MHRSSFIGTCRPAVIGIFLLGTVLTGCATTAETQRANLDQDGDACADIGAGYGSREHSNCMLVQQQRRDNARLNFLEEQRIASELTQNGLDLRDRVRAERERKRDRDRDRREERPRN